MINFKINSFRGNTNKWFYFLISLVFILGACNNSRIDEQYIKKLAKEKHWALITLIPISNEDSNSFAIIDNTYLYEIYTKNSNYNKINSFEKFMLLLYNDDIQISIEDNPRLKKALFTINNDEKNRIVYDLSISEIENDFLIKRDNELVFKSDLEEWQINSILVRMFMENYILIFDDYSGEFSARYFLRD